MNSKRKFTIRLAWTALMVWPGLSTASLAHAAGDAYPLDVCIVSGDRLGAKIDSVRYDFDGRDLRFCSAACVETFKKNPAPYMAKLDSAVVEQQLPFYPLTTCIVSGEPLGGEMGKPVDKVYNNRLVRFCCTMCPKGFAKTPETYLAKLDSAVIARQKPTYPLETCVVSGEKLGKMGAPVEYVHGNRLVRFCCKGCVATFRTNPTAYLPKIDAATKAKSGSGEQKKEPARKSG